MIIDSLTGKHVSPRLQTVVDVRKCDETFYPKSGFLSAYAASVPGINTGPSRSRRSLRSLAMYGPVFVFPGAR